jgi:exopolysaccharide production protein ExoY
MSKMLLRITKRVLDIILSCFLLVIFSPAFLIISLCILVEDRKEILLKDPLRIGLGGKKFRMYKFRSMIPDAHKVIQMDNKYKDLKSKWKEPGVKLKIDEDIRITKIGKFLRKTDLDELPQLINVLKGDMSLVGPRPMYDEELKRYLSKFPKDRKYLKNIYSVKPGITGVWQVSGRNDIDFKNRLIIDSKYIHSDNLINYLSILLKTPYVVLTRKGAHE